MKKPQFHNWSFHALVLKIFIATCQSSDYSYGKKTNSIHANKFHSLNIMPAKVGLLCYF